MSEQIHYRDYNYWLTRAKAAGFDSVDEAIVTLYQTHRSLEKVGEIMGVSGAAIRNHLCRLGVPLQKQGGKNNSSGKNGYQREVIDR